MTMKLTINYYGPANITRYCLLSGFVPYSVVSAAYSILTVSRILKKILLFGYKNDKIIPIYDCRK